MPHYTTASTSQTATTRPLAADKRRGVVSTKQKLISISHLLVGGYALGAPFVYNSHDRLLDVLRCVVLQRLYMTLVALKLQEV